MNNSFQGFIVTTSIGLLCFGLGLAAHLGYTKRMFITRGIPAVYPKNTVYALMPLGLFFLAFLPIFLWAGENALDEGPSAIIFFGLAGMDGEKNPPIPAIRCSTGNWLKQVDNSKLGRPPQAFVPFDNGSWRISIRTPGG